MRDVVELDLRATKGGRRVKIEAYVVNKISHVANCHAELVRTQYNHLCDTEFPDVAKENTLIVDVSVGANFLWEFQG